MPINYDSLDEGDALDASSLNTRVGSLQTGVNDLLKSDIEEQALRSEHVPSLVYSLNFAPGLTKVNPTPNTTTAAYTNAYNAADRTVVLGTGPGIASPPAGWAIISNGAVGVCEISFNPALDVVSTTVPPTGFAPTTSCTGLLVRLNVSLIASGAPPGAANQCVIIGLVWEADGAPGVYNYLYQSETGVEDDVDSMVVYSDIATSALITFDDTGASSIAKISGVIANSANQVTIREWNISAIPIFGGTL